MLPGAIFFVTFRLADSLSKNLVDKLRKEMHASIEKIKGLSSEAEHTTIKKQIHSKFFDRYDRLLDSESYGKCFLEIDDVAECVAEQIRAGDGHHYDLLAYTIMPNHVHILIDTLSHIADPDNFDITKYTPLHQILKGIKGVSARKCNILLKRSGTFWQKDSYDSLVRSDLELENHVNYILLNPVRAGLVNQWDEFPFSYVREDIIR